MSLDPAYPADQTEDNFPVSRTIPLAEPKCSSGVNRPKLCRINAVVNCPYAFRRNMKPQHQVSFDKFTYRDQISQYVPVQALARSSLPPVGGRYYIGNLLFAIKIFRIISAGPVMSVNDIYLVLTDQFCKPSVDVLLVERVPRFEGQLEMGQHAIGPLRWAFI